MLVMRLMILCLLMGSWLYIDVVSRVEGTFYELIDLLARTAK
jgi:hypothetical protein